MVIFVIAGVAKCESYAHISYVCRYLEKKLPDFNVSRKEFEDVDYKVWLKMINSKNGWVHRNSPIVYKELLYYGGKPYYIGGISEFWEYCYDYYGLESYLTKAELKDLAKDNYEHFKATKSREAEKPDDFNNVSFYGYDPVIDILVPELFRIEELNKPKPLRIKFYDNNENTFSQVIEFVEKDYNCKSSLVETIGELIRNCDILFILENMLELERHKPELIVIRINQLAEAISRIGKRSIKIIFANYGPACFAATLLSDTCRIRIPNIVVVSSDLGLGVLKQITEECDITMDKLFGPPVWGYIDYSQYVDLEHCLKKCDIYRPFRRTVRSTEASTLQRGTIATEFRFINYLIDDPHDVCNSAFIRKESVVLKLDRPSTYAKVSATVNLLRIWYRDKFSNEVISLGIKSDNTFGITQGLIFSQPAVLDNGTWIPCAEYPVNEPCQEIVDAMVREASAFVYNFYSRIPSHAHDTATI